MAETKFDLEEAGDLNVKRSALNVERSGAAGASAADADNPWPGLATFTEEQSGLFHGRDEEIRDLTRRAERHALTVLFGQSGLGKSSLLQAGVFPRLRADGYWPVYIRLDHGPDAPAPAEQIKALVHTDTARAGRWTSPGSAKPGESLWEFFHHRDDRLVSVAGRPIVPVLVFDQFEELFTLGAGGGAERARAVAFMSELAELVENRPSEQLVARLEDSSAEMDAFDFSRTDYRVVITLREDYLPHLESLKTIMPALMENRMRLARMTGKQALEAVLKPGAGMVDDEVARAIVEFVAGAKGGSIERLAELDVEPPLLSVICRELNEKRRTLGQTKITADLVSGNRREILTNFYERSVADLPEGMRTFVEDHLLTKSGFRDNLALETALEYPGVTRPLIDTLVSRRLLRIEERMGVQRVELTHDVLAEVIRTSRDSRQQRLAVEQVRQRERVTRRRMWLARIIAAGLLVTLTGVSWVAWRAIRAERDQARLHAEADGLRDQAQHQELAARQKAYASDMSQVQHWLAIDVLGRAQRLLTRHRPLPGQRDLRGWEWRYLWQFAQSDAQSLVTRKANAISSVAASRDGKWLAVGELFNGGLSVWNLETREETRVPAGTAAVFVAFSPREPLLAIGSTGGQSGVRLWNVTTRQIVRAIGVEGPVVKLGFSADGQTLVTLTGGLSGLITLWRTADGTKLAEHRAPNGGAAFHSPLAVAPDCSLAAHAQLRTIRVIDLATGQVKWTAPAAIGQVTALAFSPDGKILASGAGFAESAIRLWDVATGKEIGRLEGHRTYVNALVFWPDGKTLASGSGDQTIRLWDVETRTQLKALRGNTLEVYTLALLPDNRTLASGSNDGFVYLWDSTKTRAGGAFGKLPKRIVAWRFAPDSTSVLSVDAQGRVERWKGAGFQEKEAVMDLTRIDSVPLAPSDVQIAVDSPLIAVGYTNGLIQVWDTVRRVSVREIKVSDARVSPMALLGHGKRLVVRAGTGASATLREWDLIDGRETRSWRGPPSLYIDNVAFSRDERWCLWLANAPGGEMLSSLQDLTTGSAKSLDLKLQGQPGAVYSPDGRLIAGTTSQGYFRLWDAATFRETATVSDFLQGVRSPVFSPDGNRLAVSSTGREAVKLWDVESLENVLTLEGDAAFGYTAFSPDGNVLSAMGAGVLHLWRAPSWEEIEQAERADAGRPSSKP